MVRWSIWCSAFSCESNASDQFKQSNACVALFLFVLDFLKVVRLFCGSGVGVGPELSARFALVRSRFAHPILTYFHLSST